MSQEWHFAADGDGRVTSDQTYYADRGHPDLDGCMDVRGTYNPPEDAERVGGESDAATCDVVKNDGEVCGRERPCAYHD